MKGFWRILLGSYLFVFVGTLLTFLEPKGLAVVLVAPLSAFVIFWVMSTLIYVGMRATLRLGRRRRKPHTSSQ